MEGHVFGCFATWHESNSFGHCAIMTACCSVAFPANYFGKISAQPHTSLCIQFLNRENNDYNNTLPLVKQICFTIAWGCAEILPLLYFGILGTGRNGTCCLRP